MSLTEKELSEWKRNPVTMKVLHRVQEEIDILIGTVASGGIIAESIDETAMKANRLAGAIQGLTFVLELEGEEDE